MLIRRINNVAVLYVVCPAGFTYISSVNGCYKVVTQNLAWDAAGDACSALHQDAHLVVINNAQKQAAVAGFLDSTVCVYFLLLYKSTELKFATFHSRCQHDCF